MSRSELFRFHYRVAGAGLAEITAHGHGYVLKIAASSFTDPLRDMLDATLRLVRSGEGAQTTWSWQHDEAGEHRWIVRREGGDAVISIRWFERPFSPQADSDGKLVFYCRCSLRRFAIQVVGNAHRVLDSLGAEGYEQHWQAHPFPMPLYVALRSALRDPNRIWY